MYQFVNTPDRLSKILENCKLSTLAINNQVGSMQCFGDDHDQPEVLHIYESSTPKVTDPYRLFIIESVRFEYREIT